MLENNHRKKKYKVSAKKNHSLIKNYNDNDNKNYVKKFVERFVTECVIAVLFF